VWCFGFFGKRICYLGEKENRERERERERERDVHRGTVHSFVVPHYLSIDEEDETKTVRRDDGKVQLIQRHNNDTNNKQQQVQCGTPMALSVDDRCKSI
jgi:hypothetical protein